MQPATAATAKQAQAAIQGQLTALRDGNGAGAAARQSRRLNRRFGSSAEFLRVIQARRPELTNWQRLSFGPVRTGGGQYARASVGLEGKNGARTRALFLLVREGGQLKIDRLRTDPGR